jgi:H+-transporting ATPase
MRDGSWHEAPAAELVPGDLIDLKLGDQIPADAIMLAGNPVEVDQSGLTGESLPVEVTSGGYFMLGSMLKTGQVKAVVVATGINTSYGEAAKLIDSVNEVGHLRHVINSACLRRRAARRGVVGADAAARAIPFPPLPFRRQALSAPCSCCAWLSARAFSRG